MKIMTDTTTTITELKELVAKLVTEREWEQFHSPKNLSMDIAVEASEVMEKFLWIDSEESKKLFEQKRDEIEAEMADVMIALLALCNVTQTNLADAVKKKLREIAQKYPIEKARGKALKYTDL